MLNIYDLNKDQCLVARSDDADTSALTQALWLDLVDPSDDERHLVEIQNRQTLPDTEDVEEIEASARSYQDEAGGPLGAGAQWPRSPDLGRLHPECQ